MYVWKYGGWFAWESYWVIGAVSTAAILMWIATRLGKNQPVPCLFIIGYAGALYGISDLSPWVRIFGRRSLAEMVMTQFPNSLAIETPHDTVALLLILAILMGIPALLAICTWSSLIDLLRVARKSFHKPKSWLAHFVLASRLLGALAFIGGAAWCLLQPNPHLIRTIRLPMVYETVKRDPPQNGDYQEAPTICAWNFSPDGKHLFALFSNRRLLKTQLTHDGAIDSVPISCDPLPSNRMGSKRRIRGTIEEIDPNEIAVCSVSIDFPHEYELWAISPEKLLLHHHYLVTSDSIDVLDLSPPLLMRPPFGSPPYSKDVRSISNNGRYLVTRTSPGSGEVESFYKWDTLSWRKEAFAIPSSKNSRPLQVAVTNSGKIVWYYSEYANATGATEHLRIPIVEHLILSVHHRQLAAIGPLAKRVSKHLFPRGLRARESWSNAKFTDDDRYLIIQDEDESADLFHVFAMQ